MAEAEVEARVAPASAYGAPTRTQHLSHPPSRTVDHDIRCHRCHKLLMEMAARPWRGRCRGCKEMNESPPLPGAEGSGFPEGPGAAREGDG